MLFINVLHTVDLEHVEAPRATAWVPTPNAAPRTLIEGHQIEKSMAMLGIEPKTPDWTSGALTTELHGLGTQGWIIIDIMLT